MTVLHLGSGRYCYASSPEVAMADGGDPGLIEMRAGSSRWTAAVVRTGS